YPNPSSQPFNFRIESATPGFVDLSVIDASGRIMEVRQNVAANITLTLGHNLRPGTYYVEAVQGKERRRVKLIRTAQ
ncbi:MAG TPA: T9SS type A sorting domain-containing protein, partial [Flavisolibacter sp.]